MPGCVVAFYSFSGISQHAHCGESLKSRPVFTLIAKYYRQIYAKPGIATDSARSWRCVPSATYREVLPAMLQGAPDARIYDSYFLRERASCLTAKCGLVDHGHLAGR